jgi:hypothetical protein
MVMTFEEQAAMLFNYGSWEKACDAFVAYNPERDLFNNAWFDKIINFFRDLYRHFFNPSMFTVQEVMDALTTGEIWKRPLSQGIMLDTLTMAQYEAIWDAHLAGEVQMTPKALDDLTSMLAEQARFQDHMLPLGIVPRYAMAEALPTRMTTAVDYAVGKGRKVEGWIGTIVKDVLENSAPTVLSDPARTAHSINVSIMGTVARKVAQAVQALRQHSAVFQPLSKDPQENVILMAAIYDAWEKGTNSGKADFDAIRPVWREFSNEFWAMVQDIHEGAAGYVENYFPRLFKDPLKAQNVLIEHAARIGKTLTGSEGWTKRRVMELYSLSILPKEKGGLGLEPLFDNIGDMMVANLMEKGHFMVGMTIFHSYQSSGLAGLHLKGKQPAGWIPLDDKIWRKYMPKLTRSDKIWREMVRKSHKKNVAMWEELPLSERIQMRTPSQQVKFKDKAYYASPEVAQVLSNFTSPGMRRSALFRAYDNFTNWVRTVLVQLSGFHLMFTSFSKMSQASGQWLPTAIGAAVRGDFATAGNALKHLATEANPYGEFKFGKALVEEYYNPGQHPEFTEMLNLMEKAGIRMFSQDDEFIAKLSDSIVEAWPTLGIAGFGPKQQNIVKKVLGFTMNEWVPKIKMTAIFRQLGYELEQLEKTALEDGRQVTEAEQIQLAQTIARNADNIYGQMVYDNLSMRKAIKDWMRFFIAFPGWNIGSTQKFFGAASAFTKGGYGLAARGAAKVGINLPAVTPPTKGTQLSRDFYLGMMMVSSVVGGLLQMMLTGEPPESPVDLLNPKTGAYLTNGQEERVRLPSYMRDAYSIATHPIETVKHKLNWPIRMWNEVIENQDFFGKQVRDPFAPVTEQAGSVATHIAKSLIPFGISGMMRTASPTARWLNPLGITTTPRNIANTTAMNMVDEYNKLTRPATTTKVQSETIELKRKMSDALVNGRLDEFQSLIVNSVKTGRLTMTQVKNIVEEANLPRTVPQFQKLPLDWALKVFNVANPAEKELWQPYLLKKISKAKPEQVVLYRDVLQKTLTSIGFSRVAEQLDNLAIPDKPIDVIMAKIRMRKQAQAFVEDLDLGIGAANEAKLYDSIVDNFEKMERVKKPSRRERLEEAGFDTEQWALGRKLRHSAQSVL